MPEVVGKAEGVEEGRPGPTTLIREDHRQNLVIAFRGLLLFGYEFFLIMLFFFQLQSYSICTDAGDSCSRLQIVGAGVVGVLFSVAPACAAFHSGLREGMIAFFEGFDDRCGTTCSRGCKISLAALHVIWLILFIVFAVLPFESAAELSQIATEIRIREGCEGGYLFEIRENLTYALESGFTTSVQRILQNQVEPANFESYSTTGSEVVSVEKVQRTDPKKYSLNYESGHLTKVYLKFDKHVARRSGKSFSVQLRYLARPYGDLGDCSDGGAVCPDTSNASKSKMKGWWSVHAEDDIPNSVILKGCSSATCNADWTVPVGTLSRSDEKWNLNLEGPVAIGMGTDACPLAWSVGSRNIWWVCTAVALAAAACMCAVLANGPSGDGVVPLLACVCFWLIVAFVFFMLATTSDFWASDGAR